MTAEAPLARSASRERKESKESKDRLDTIPENDSPRVKIEKEKEGGVEGAGGADQKKIWGDEDTEPTEAIVRVLWGDFKAQTKRKIDEVMAFGIVCSFYCPLLLLYYTISHQISLEISAFFFCEAKKAFSERRIKRKIKKVEILYDLLFLTSQGNTL